MSQRPGIVPESSIGRQATASIGCALALVALAVAGFAPVVAKADIYRYVDQRGMVHLADRPAGPGWKLYWKGNRKVRRSALRTRNKYGENRREFGPLIDQVAQKYRLDGALVHAVVRAESAYNPSAISKKGAVGLMQLMPGTAARYGVRDRYNPAQNLKAGVSYLRDLLVEFNDVVLALAAYNAGENAVIKYGRKVPPFPETRTYVRRVLAFYREIRPSS